MPSIPAISPFLSPGITSIILRFVPDPPEAMVASIVTNLPKLCPNLQVVNLRFLPRAGEANELVSRLPNLRGLSAFIDGEASLPSALLPNELEDKQNIFIEVLKTYLSLNRMKCLLRAWWGSDV